MKLKVVLHHKVVNNYSSTVLLWLVLCRAGYCEMLDDFGPVVGPMELEDNTCASEMNSDILGPW